MFQIHYTKNSEFLHSKLFGTIYNNSEAISK